MLQVKVKNIYEIEYEDIPEPILNPNEAIIKVASVGICGSDIHVFKGENPVLKPPVVQGHEFGGVIESIKGKGGRGNFKIGQKVSVFPTVNCGECFYCKKDLRHLCENQKIFDGGSFDGAMKEKIAVPIDNLLSLPDSFDLKYSSLVEPVSVAVHSAGIFRNSNILVIGIGTIGSLVQQVCKNNGNTIITLDINKNSLDRSVKLGADLVCDFADPEKKQKITGFLGEEKIDAVVDCVGRDESITFATDMVRKKGTIVLVGVPKKPISVNAVDLLLKEIDLKGSYLYSLKDFLKAGKYIVKNLIDLESLNIKTFPLDKAKEGYEYKVNNPAEKVLLVNNV
jgi:threonine dehydrogenase-like Zn-dependent dehydrogenase